MIVQTLRIPRTELGVLVGAALGLAGVLIQAVTRNPLADPGILGVNAGAFFAVSVGAAFFGVTATADQVWWSIAGAMIAAAMVYLVGTAGRGGRDPGDPRADRRRAAGGADGAEPGHQPEPPGGLRQAALLAAGSLQGRTTDTVSAVLPFIVVGLVLAVLLARSLNVFSLGEDLARALGARVTTTRTLGFIAITVLCGAATAAAGTDHLLRADGAVRRAADRRPGPALDRRRQPDLRPGDVPGRRHPRPRDRPQRAAGRAWSPRSSARRC